MAWLIPERFTDDHCRRHGWWLLLVITAVLYLPGLGTMPLMDRDEPRFANATVEMMQRGAWAIPYFNSDPAMSDAKRIEMMRKGKGAMEVGYRFDKPPLTYWWMRLHYSLFGVNEFAARLHSVVATWLVALVTFGLASRLAGARAGLTAGLAWLTTLQVIVHGRLCVADMPMVFFVALACWALLELLIAEEPPQKFTRWHWILYLSLGLGFLAKGPIALLVPGLALVLWRFAFWRKPVPWVQLKAGKGLLISLAIIAAWGLPALYLTEGLYWRVGMQEHVVERGTKALNGRIPMPGYYLVTALLSLFPWIAFLPLVWTEVREKWDAKLAFLVSWLVAPYIIFTLYATQLPHYVMPGFPAAMVLLVACGDFGLAKGWRKAFLVILPALLWLIGIGIAFAVEHFKGTFDASHLLNGAVLFRTLAVFGIAVSWPFVVRTSNKPGFLLTSFRLLVILATTITVADITVTLRDTHPAAQLAAKAGPLPNKIDLVGWQFTEPSLVFHFHHHWTFPNKLDSVNQRMSRKGPRIVVLLRREWTVNHFFKEKMAGKTDFTTDQDFSKEVDQVIAAHPDYKIETFTGLNAARASWAEVVMLVRK